MTRLFTLSLLLGTAALTASLIARHRWARRRRRDLYRRWMGDGWDE